MRLLVPLTLALALLAGCSTERPEFVAGFPTERVNPTPSEQAWYHCGEGGCVEMASEPPSPAATRQPDVTSALQALGEDAAWTDSVVSATQTEPGRLVVETSIVDPRGDEASPEAIAAIDICEAAVVLVQSRGVDDPVVSVMEADGSTFVIYGHPAYPNGCSEI